MTALLLVALLLPQDSVPKDSQPKDSQPKPVIMCEMCLGVAIAAFGVTLLAAPSSFLLFKESFQQDTMPLGFTDTHIIAYFATGGGPDKPGKGWDYSGNVELRAGRVFGALSVQHLRYSDLGTFRFTSVRTGYLWHPRNPMAGGVTLGYRWARGDAVQNAFEVGFPFVVGSQRGWVRFEPTYLMSHAGVTWNYRVQMEAPIQRTPFLVGMNLEAKTVRQGGVYFGNIDVALGVRF